MSSNQILFYKSDNRPAARVVSATTVFEECLDKGRWINLYWSSAGQVQRENVVSGMPGDLEPTVTPMGSFDLELDGQSLRNRWAWVGSSIRAGKKNNTQEAVVKLSHQVRAADLSVVTSLDESGVLTRYLEITNKGTTPAALSKVSSFSGLLWHNQFGWGEMSFDYTANSPFKIGYYKAKVSSQEGDFVWQPLSSETLRIERTWGCQFGAPNFIIKNEVTGEMFFIGMAWSGNYYAEFICDEKYKTLSFSMGPAGAAPIRVISPGETVTSPEVHMMPIFGNMDKAIAAWYKHMRESVLPKNPNDKNIYTVAGRVVEAPGEWILREVDIAFDMGCEAFMVDAGWYGKTFCSWPDLRGDWQEGPFLPGGKIETIRDYVHKKGMLFGMWMEPETMGENSEIIKNHPEWLLRTDGGQQESTCCIDLSNPDAAKYVEESIFHVIGDYKLDFYKADYNEHFPEGGQNLRDGFLDNEEFRHYEVLYGIYDRIHEKYPDVMLENCASGGGRLDLGMMSRFHYGCQSDYSLFPYSIRSINGLTLFYPPEALCYYHNHVSKAHQMVELDTHLRVTLFTRPIFVGFGAQNALQDNYYNEKTRYYIELHKGFCRPVLESCPAVYHHTPDIGVFAPADWCVLEYAKSDKTAGYAGVFKVGNEFNESLYNLRLKGVDPSRKYKVTMENDLLTFEAEGYKLMNEGLAVTLERAGLSELVRYEAV